MLRYRFLLDTDMSMAKDELLPLQRTSTSGLACCPAKRSHLDSLSSNNGLNLVFRLPELHLRPPPASLYLSKPVLRHFQCRSRLQSPSLNCLRRLKHRSRRSPKRTRRLRTVFLIP